MVKKGKKYDAKMVRLPLNAKVRKIKIKIKIKNVTIFLILLNHKKIIGNLILFKEKDMEVFGSN